MNMQDFIYVAKVAEKSSFSKAAEELFVTESTISQRIKKLEDEINIRLFDRSTRSVSLTSEGKVFLKDALVIIKTSQHLSETMRQLSRESERKLSLGMTTHMYASKIHLFFREFCIKHSDIDARLQIMSYQELHEALLAGTIDHAIIKMYDVLKDYFDISAFDHVLLKKEQIYVLISEKLMPKNKNKLKLSDVQNLPVVVDSNQSFMYQMIKRLYDNSGIPLHISNIKAGDSETVLYGVEQGDGISFGSDAIINYYKDRYSFAAIPLSPACFSIVYLVSLKDYMLASYDKKLIKELKDWLN